MLVSCALLLAATAPAAAELADTPWPMFQHDPQHSGRGSLLGPLFATSAPGAGDVKFWQGFNTLRNSPTIGLDGTIYVAVDPRPEGPTHHGYLCAINPDMTQKWCTMFRADASPSSAAIGADGTIYVGDRDNTLTAFDPTDGRKKWLYNKGFEGDLNASPTIGVNGTIYVAFGQNLDGHGVFTALNPNGTLKWKCLIGTGVGASSAAIDQDGFLYQADVSGTLHKFKDHDTFGTLPSRTCADSVEVWKTSVGGKITGSPVVSPGGVIYIGSNGGLSAVRASDGEVLWKFPTPGMVDQTPALATDGTIYFGAKSSQIKTIYAVRPDGTLKWQYGPVQLYADRGGFPILGGDGILYVGLGNGVSVFSPDGVLLWSYLTGDAVLSFPAIGGTATTENGGTAVLYLASGDGRLYTISSPRHGTSSNDPPVAIADPGRSGMVGEVLSFDGSSSFDPDGDLISFAWDFGDGTSAVGKTVSHTYLDAGTYTVTLTVSDGLAETSVSLTVTVASTGGPRVVDDNFNRVDSTTLGHGWEEAQGDFQISANELRNAPLKATHIAIQPSLAGLNHSASASFASVDNNPGPRFGIVLRFQGPKNYYVFYRQSGGTNALRISKVVNGIETVLAKQAVGLPALNTSFRLGGDASGTTLTLILNGVVKLSVTDATFSGGSIGILLGTGSSSIRQYRVDDFSGRAE